MASLTAKNQKERQSAALPPAPEHRCLVCLMYLSEWGLRTLSFSALFPPSGLGSRQQGSWDQLGGKQLIPKAPPWSPGWRPRMLQALDSGILPSDAHVTERWPSSLRPAEADTAQPKMTSSPQALQVRASYTQRWALESPPVTSPRLAMLC